MRPARALIDLQALRHNYRLARELSGARALAVKLFQGEVTSDGLPASERAACVGAGSHPGLIPVLGEVR